MFSPDEVKKRFFPGQEWLYLKVYMGPETVEEWLCFHFPVLLRDCTKLIPGLRYFFIRYLDPEFHLRLRFYVPKRVDISRLINLFNLHSALFMRQGLIWKVDVSTYERETERYGTKQIEVFESAFHADSSFWMAVLPWLALQDDREELRWKIALVNLDRYFRDLVVNKEDVLSIVNKVVATLKKEQKVSRATQYQIDQKYRSMRPELQAMLDGEFPGQEMIEAKLNNRSYLLTELFESQRVGENFFPGDQGARSITDLIHMSTNRGLRARHRMQEYVIYCFYGKLLRTQMALV